MLLYVIVCLAVLFFVELHLEEELIEAVIDMLERLHLTVYALRLAACALCSLFKM